MPPLRIAFFYDIWEKKKQNILDKILDQLFESRRVIPATDKIKLDYAESADEEEIIEWLEEISVSEKNQLILHFDGEYCMEELLEKVKPFNPALVVLTGCKDISIDYDINMPVIKIDDENYSILPQLYFQWFGNCLEYLPEYKDFYKRILISSSFNAIREFTNQVEKFFSKITRLHERSKRGQGVCDCRIRGICGCKLGINISKDTEIFMEEAEYLVCEARKLNEKIEITTEITKVNEEDIAISATSDARRASELAEIAGNLCYNSNRFVEERTLDKWSFATSAPEKLKHYQSMVESTKEKVFTRVEIAYKRLNLAKSLIVPSQNYLSRYLPENGDIHGRIAQFVVPRDFLTLFASSDKGSDSRIGFTPQGELLTKFLLPRSGFNCDKCCETLPKGEIIFSNREENWDLCQKCFNSNMKKYE